MKLTPVFNFAGQCEQAMELYGQAFGTQPDFILRYADADPRDWQRSLTDEQKRYVYHAEMTIAGQRCFFSDLVEFDVARGTALFLTVTFDEAPQVLRAYDALKDGATVLWEPHATTYSSCFTSLVDRFGVRWGLMTEQTER